MYHLVLVVVLKRQYTYCAISVCYHGEHMTFARFVYLCGRCVLRIQCCDPFFLGAAVDKWCITKPQQLTCSTVEKLSCGRLVFEHFSNSSVSGVIRECGVQTNTDKDGPFSSQKIHCIQWVNNERKSVNENSTLPQQC